MDGVGQLDVGEVVQDGAELAQLCLALGRVLLLQDGLGWGVRGWNERMYKRLAILESKNW